MTNLLASKQQKERRRAYTTRLAIAAGAALSGVAFIGTLALLPVYISVRGELEATKVEVEAFVQAGQEQEVQSERDALITARKQIEALSGLFKRESIATDVLRAVVERRAEGVRISNIQYTFDDGIYTVRVSGDVDERRQLQEYVSALQSDILFSSATIPVSALAEAERGVFVVTAKGALQ